MSYSNKKRSSLGTAGILLLGAVALTGCDFAVTNPGPVADEFLDNAGAHQVIVNGAMREMNYALNTLAMDVGNRMREVSAGDASPWEGITYYAFVGQSSSPPNYLRKWGPLQAARWITTDALSRFDRVGASADVISQAYLWQGLAYKFMGEYFCEVVYDGGSTVPISDARARAEVSFTNAMAAGGSAETTMAAQAARAGIRVTLGDWTGAVSDAGAVPSDFVFVLPFYGDGYWRYNNAWVQGGGTAGNLGAGGGSYTIWNTYFVDYFLETADPRVAWVETGTIQQTALTEYNVTEFPYYAQLKYLTLGDDINMTSGEEMRLIEAEGLLRASDMAGAMTIINAVRERALAGLGNLAPATLEEAWAFLKRERGIEMWLEGRRLNDVRRWQLDGTPGDLQPLETGLPNSVVTADLSNRTLCLPIPDREVERNPNLTTLTTPGAS
jgi:hypothetical protein